MAKNELKLIIAAETKQAEGAMRRMKEQFAGVGPAAKTATAGTRDLSRQTATLKNSQDALSTSMGKSEGLTSRLTSSVGRLVAAYAGYRAITSFYGAVIQGSRDAEKAQFGLTASVEAASREFSDTGGIDQWRDKVKELSADLRVYSETDVSNAAARTIDMTKRLGLSAVQMEEVIRRTADLSAGKTDLEGGIERVTAALRGEAEASEFLGLTLNETYVKSWYEANNATGKAWKDLTDLEKAQVRYNVLLEQTAATQGRAAASARTFNGALELVRAQVSNAIANNEDLGDALQRVASLLSDNADEIARFVATMASALGDVVEFTIKNKELLGVLIGTGGLLVALGKTAGAVRGVGDALKMAGAIRTPDVLSADGRINAALASRLGLYGALAVTIAATVASFNSMRQAQDEAAEAAHRLAIAEAENQGRADAATASTGMQIEGIQHLNQLLREGKVVRDEVSGQYLSLEQAQAKAAAAADGQARAEIARAESFRQVTAIVERGVKKYGDLSAETLSAADKQRVLNDALGRVKAPVTAAADAVDKLGAVYYDAATALEHLTAGQEGYEAALARNLKAENEYVQAAAALRERTMAAMQEGFREEERSLKQSLDRRLLAEEERLSQGFTTQQAFDKFKVAAEAELLATIVDMRAAAVDKARELYGEDTAEYRAAVADKVDAELDFARARKETRETNQAFIQSLRAVGDTGEESGRRAARGMREIGAAAGDSLGVVRMLTEEQRKQASSDFFGEQYTSIQRTIEGLTSLEEAQAWADQTVTTIGGRAWSNKDLMFYGGRPGANAFERSGNKYARDLYLQKLEELGRSGDSVATPAPGGVQRPAEQKQITLRFQSPGGKSVSGAFGEREAAQLMDILKQAGMTTA